MSEMPWVRFFASDWLGGTRGMGAAETGIYITLVATMYERGEPIPEDHSRLARLCGASNSAFKKALEALVSEGKILRVEGGLWNERVAKERVYSSEKSEVGFQAANARWNRKRNKNNDTNDANAMQSQCDGNANQKPEPQPIEKPVGFSAREARKKPRGWVEKKTAFDALNNVHDRIDRNELQQRNEASVDGVGGTVLQLSSASR